MTPYRTARSVLLPLDFRIADISLHGPAAMQPWYVFGPDAIMPKRRARDEILVEEVRFVGKDGVEHRYGQRDMVRDTGLPLQGNPHPWI